MQRCENVKSKDLTLSVFSKNGIKSQRCLGTCHIGGKMLSKTSYEQQLLNEVKGLPGSDIARIVKIVHLIKEEIIEKKEKGFRKDILQYAGMLKDLTAVESEVFDEAAQRRSLLGGLTPGTLPIPF